MQFRPRNHHLSHDSPMLNHATEPPVLPELPVRSHRFRRIRRIPKGDQGDHLGVAQAFLDP